MQAAYAKNKASKWYERQELVRQHMSINRHWSNNSGYRFPMLEQMGTLLMQQTGFRQALGTQILTNKGLNISKDQSYTFVQLRGTAQLRSGKWV